MKKPIVKANNLNKRKPARRVKDVPPAVVLALECGETETKNLVEWLRVNQVNLLLNILPQLGLRSHVPLYRRRSKELRELKILDTLAKITQWLYSDLQTHPRAKEIFEAMRKHPSDIVRQWAAGLVGCETKISLEQRFRRIRPFAKDKNPGVREIAWMVLRSQVANDLRGSIRLLEFWVQDRDPNVRRFAIELTRPCGVWTQHLSELKEKPQLGLKLLERLRSDESRYVQTSVSNWLNDASKMKPKWVKTVCARWLKESKTIQTAWIVKRALRTIKKPVSK